MTLRDKLGTFFLDSDFAELYSIEGQPALRPWHLALVCVMQYMANLSDRGAAEAVAARLGCSSRSLCTRSQTEPRKLTSRLL